MKELNMKYLGKKDRFFLFSKEDDDEIVRFHHVRSDLIHEYKLHTQDFMNRVFKVKFFISEQGNRTSRIISDLQLD